MEEHRDTRTGPPQNAHPPHIQPPDEINLYEYYLVIKKRWKLIVLIFLAATISAAVASLLMTKIYRAETTILPIDTGSSGRVASMVGQLTELPFVGSMVPGSYDKLVNILESRTVRGRIIESLEFMEMLFPRRWYQTIWESSEPPTLQKGIERLGELTKIRKDSTGDLIRISVEFWEPELAARIANMYPIELERFLSENALSIEKRTRVFLGERYRQTKEQLARVEEALKEFQTEHKLVALDEQTEAAVGAIAELRAQMMAKEVELGVFQKFVTDTNPNVVRIKDEIRGLKEQLNAMESNDGSPEAGLFPALDRAPALGLEYMRLERDVLINQKLFELLTQQHEMARIEEAREDVAFQVIDKAVPPETSFKPKRRLIVLFTGTAAVLIGLLLALFLEYVENVTSREVARK
jgi:uncharacterized protein involved in exopolysaccharide biosynthesis